MSRWDNFTPTELIVINDALNTAFESSEEGSWDACEDKQIIDQLNKP